MVMRRQVLLIVWLAAMAWLAVLGLWVVVRAAGTDWAPVLGVVVFLGGVWLLRKVDA